MEARSPKWSPLRLSENFMETATTAPIVEKPAPALPAGLIDYDHFTSVVLKVGIILECKPHPNPKSTRLYVLQVALGEEKPRQICAGIREHYTPEQLIGKKIIVVSNLAPRKMLGEDSNGMLLAATNPSGVPILATFDGLIEAGTTVK